MTDFQITLQRLLRVSGKSLHEVAFLGGLDRSYLLRLTRGEKVNPSPETIVKIWVGLCMDKRFVEADPTFIEGLAELLLTAGLTQYANAKRAE
jgi:hypothetical protein